MSSLKATLTRELDIPFDAPGADKPCLTHVKVFGELTAGGKTPLVALHGGPGVSMDYILSLSDLSLPPFSIPVVFYDQIGNGHSTHLPEKRGDASFWTDALFLAELDNVLKYLNIQDDYALWGSSWGGMLAARHALSQPKGLKKLVLASAPSSIARWLASANALRRTLPPDVQAALDAGEESRGYGSKEYQAAMDVFFSSFGCRLKPLPEEVKESGRWVGRDDTVWMTMNGPSEFVNTGTLNEWSIIGELHAITTPTLVTNGAYDEAQDDVVRPFVDEIPGATWVKFENSAHMAHFEERERYMQVIGEFLLK
ncbi:proline-specific peptidase [Exidia glandulosa HHB12029]|uniref:Proline-specific peptidase n=1 Tax=Exidia glandulosa HHB12029 TaxID=1314781 RepID=A0A165EL30_EXIGL|nr:proline-specific peptidase [Exidia glandulosa HHB12029]